MCHVEFDLCADKYVSLRECIFPVAYDPYDFAELEEIARKVLPDDGKVTIYDVCHTSALIAVLNVCRERNIEVILKYYDRLGREYKTQYVY